MAGTHQHLIAARPIANTPFIVVVPSGASGGSIGAFLSGLSNPNFDTIADPTALWAQHATDTLQQHSTGGSAWVVSAEAYKYLKAFRY